MIAAACRSTAGPAPARDVRSDAARLDRAAHVCAKVASCSHPHDAARERDPGACVDWWIAHDRAAGEALAACVEAARGCAGVDACVRASGDARAIAFCREHAGARTGCDRARVVTCGEDDPNESTSVDCGAFGGTCGEVKHAGGLVARACVSQALCGAGAPDVRCDGRAIVACHDGAVERTECAPGARCEERRAADGAVSVLCEPPAHRHCDVVGARWCERSSLVSCQAHGPFGEAVETECSSFGLACDASGKSGASCVASVPRACERGAPKCDGDALVFCAAGRAMSVSCRDLGFAACNPDAHGVDAACTAD